MLLAECHAREQHYILAIDFCRQALSYDASRKDEIEQKIAIFQAARNEQLEQSHIGHNNQVDNEIADHPPAKAAKRSKALPIYVASAVVLIIGVLVSTLFLLQGSQPDPSPTSAIEDIQFFDNDLTAFRKAADFPPIMADFDDLQPGVDLTNQTINGIRFEKSSDSSAPPIVVQGKESFTSEGYRCEPIAERSTQRLFPVTGRNILSPGGPELAPGPNPALERDDLVLVFDEPVSAIGFDLLWQAATGTKHTVTIEDAEGNILRSEGIAHKFGSPGVAAPPTATFVGFVSSKNNINKLTVTDTDDDNCLHDANIGYDSIRYKVLGTREPELSESYSFVREWGSKGTNAGQFNTDVGPRGIVIRQTDRTEIFVTDYINHRIQSFGADGRFLEQWPFTPASQDIDFDSDGMIYARGIERVEEIGVLTKLNPDMELIWQVEAPAAQWVSFGVCVDLEGNVHVPVAPTVEVSEIHMNKYDPEGNLISEYGHGLVNGAANCAVSPDGSVYVTAQDVGALRRFSPEGKLLESIPIGYPIKAFTIDMTTGDFFMAMVKWNANSNSYRAIMRKYDMDFTLLAEWGELGAGAGKFSADVRDLAVDSAGNVYMTDGPNGLIQMFRKN